MQEYQHQFDNVEDYLHHRPPYLMVGAVESMGDHEVVTRADVTGDEYFFAGHFPGAPIVPGAMMQEMTTQSAGILIAARYNPMKEFNTEDPFFNKYALGVLIKVKQSRFRRFARPGDSLVVTAKLEERVGSIFEFSATIRCGDSEIMRNRFQLTNILSETLQGDAARGEGVG